MDSELPPIAVFFGVPLSEQYLARTLCKDLFGAVDWYICDDPDRADCLFSSGPLKSVEGQLLLNWPPEAEQCLYDSLIRELTERLWHGNEAVALIWRQAMQVVGPESSDLEVQAALNGSRAWVYRARSRSLGTTLVAKAQPQSPDLLCREARIMELLPPAVAPRLYRLNRWHGQPLLLMEDVGSCHFSRLERGSGPAFLPRGSLRALLDTLGKVHGAGWAHGDIKPEHILFPEADRAVLIDWGLAEGDGLYSSSRLGRWSGTPLYMAPERFSGGPPSAASDLYSLGVVMIEWLSGGFPSEWFDLPVSQLHTAVLSRWQASAMSNNSFFEPLLALTSPDPARRFDGWEAFQSCCLADPVHADQDN